MNDCLERMLQADLSLLRRLNLATDSAWLPFFRAVSDSTSVIAYGVPALLMVVALLRRSRSGLYRAVLTLVTVIVSDYAALGLKLWLRRERPYALHDFIVAHSDGGNPSFPSGHTVQAAALAVALSLACRRPSLTAVSICWALLVGYSRLALGVHYPSDVLGACLLAAGVACLVILPFRRLEAPSGGVDVKKPPAGGAKA